MSLKRRLAAAYLVGSLVGVLIAAGLLTEEIARCLLFVEHPDARSVARMVLRGLANRAWMGACLGAALVMLLDCLGTIRQALRDWRCRGVEVAASPALIGPRRFQYRLRTLLLMVALTCVGMSWIAARVERVRREKYAVDMIRNVGGQFSFAVAWSVDLQNTDVTDGDLASLRCLRNLRFLDLDGTRISDAGLAHLRDSVGLERLCIAGTQVTDDGLRHLGELSHLRFLDLSGAPIRGPGLRHLQGLSSLRRLDLDRTSIDDQAIRELPVFPELESIYLSNTAVSDSGIGPLVRYPKLRRIDLQKTRVTKSGLIELQNSLREDVWVSGP